MYVLIPFDVNQVPMQVTDQQVPILVPTLEEEWSGERINQLTTYFTN